ncbi:MAG TPA: DNA helicase UvrD [Gammaproteobacteria bacterium]|nr:DNA helicase UvrD [Gammaproteobacteria bacterium]
MSIQAATPQINATVTASAGSGKTWMLVTRILRLLLEGAEPGSILALTFTRKAAAEMQQRLSERLYQLATVDNTELTQLLKELDLDTHYALKARNLYEAHQYCDYPVRTLTFHSFCQDLLARFPLEADIPPGFDLLESADLLIQQARNALYSEATLDMQGELACHLEQLMRLSGGLFNLDRVLNSFLQHRSDWWAYTDDNEIESSVDYARQQLAQKLELDTDQLDAAQHYNAFFSTRTIEQLKSYAKLLALNPTKTNLQKADRLTCCLAADEPGEHTFTEVQACFIKKDGNAYALKDTPTLRKKLGDDSADTLLELHELIPARIFSTQNILKKIHTYQLNQHWFYCGEKFIEHYQTLKRQQRLLDFTDLEWRSYKLLQNSENALWIQYKLDQQIQHLLIDEFQDTNPTQWQLILPLLEEMAAAESEKQRSVFLVGDEKQSIYSFRRAKPELQLQATNWLHQHLNARAFPLNKSWRSSPAIIHLVNAVFQQDQFKLTLPAFEEHHTHLEQLPGKVEALPLWHMSDMGEKTDGIYCRNPLKQPRPEIPGIHQKEAQQIAQHIKQLIHNKTPITQGSKTRAINYNDIYILLRKRAHVADYERAFREAGIAYLGTNRGTFLSCLEIQDMLALLSTLLTPFNNLALAQVLKSPLFSATDDDLQLIAAVDNGNWFERISQLAENLDKTHPIHRAAHYLAQWHALTDRIPVHDLLDRIFSDADVPGRYQRCTPEPLQARVAANLTLFLEMALDLDSGRYPSLMHFLLYLRSLQNTQNDAPDEAPMETREPRVKIMTIHASKGLEAPVVYLADTISTTRDKSSLSTLIDWPVEDRRPAHFQLIASARQQDDFTARLNQLHKNAQQKEDANLLYVAITRARQYLFISGCQPDKGPFTNWYQPVFTALQSLTGNQDDEHLSYQFAEPNTINAALDDTHEKENMDNFEIDPGLSRIIDKQKTQHIKTAQTTLSPSYADKQLNYHSQGNKETDEDAQQRGIAIHRLLELVISDSSHLDSELFKSSTLQRVANEMQIEISPQLEDWYGIALQNIQHPRLKHIFRPDNAVHVYNECPIQYLKNNSLVYGVIDRLIVNENDVIVVDYKTHSGAHSDNLKELSQNYPQQMQLYSDGISELWPDKRIKAYLLFTECMELFQMI